MSETRRTVEQLLVRLGAGEPQHIADCFTSEAVDWYVPGAEGLPWTGRRSTRAEIVEYFRQLSDVFIVGPDDISVHTLLIDGTDAIVLGTISRTIVASHRQFTTPIAMHLTVQSGLIARLHLDEDTLIVARAFGLQSTVGEPANGKPRDSHGFQGGSVGRLAGKVAVITGATSGIGLAAAKLFAEEGARVFISGRREPELRRAEAAIGHGVIGVRADVSNIADLDCLYQRIRRDAGHLDIVFANAGIGEFLPLTAVTELHVDQTFATNVKGTLFTV